MKILIIYYSKYVYPLRTTVKDHLYSFDRYSGHHCYYLNLAKGHVPTYLTEIDFDLVIYHTLFFAKRWARNFFTKLISVAEPLKNVGKVKIALPQDEFINTDLLCHFINAFNVNHVFSVAPASEWPKIYKDIDFNRVKFHVVLTGYLDPNTVKRVEKLTEKNIKRTKDIGYRAWRAEPWLGKHGMLKVAIADLFQKEGKNGHLAVDISTDETKTIVGDKWYEFLLQCKYTIGVEGGASILDRDGSVRECTDSYLQNKPNATFTEVEAACFPERDGELNLVALSPRHLEACLTRTCQILIEGSYSGVLQANKHYIVLKPDFSNLDEVISKIKVDEERESIVNAAYKDIVASGLFTYAHFVTTILACIKEEQDSSKPLVLRDQLRWLRAKWGDWLNWRLQACYGMTASTLKKVTPGIFAKIYNLMRRFNKV